MALREDDEDESWDKLNASPPQETNSEVIIPPILHSETTTITNEIQQEQKPGEQTTTPPPASTSAPPGDNDGEDGEENEYNSELEQYDPDSRLDVGLLALLYNELAVSQLPQTAKQLLEEVGLESIVITTGLPPRLKDLVDLWNAFHDEEFCAPKPKPAASAAGSGKTGPARKRTPPTMVDLSTAASSPSARSRSTSLPQDLDNSTFDLEDDDQDDEYAAAAPSRLPLPPTTTATTTHIPYSAAAASAAARKRVKLDSPAGSSGATMQRHGPWLVEEEDLLRKALLANPDEKLEEITKMVETRSVNGVAKHLQKIKRGWGQMTNKRLCDVLLTDQPTFERLMCMKPIDRTEKEMISWLEWFIFLNAKQVPEFLEQIQIEAREQQELAASVTWSEQEKVTLRQILEETDVELLDRFAQRFPEPQIVAFCQHIEQQPPLSAQDAKKKRKTKKAVQGRWTIEEGVAFEKVFKETPRNFRALCDAVPLRSRESVALRIRRLNGDPNPRKRSNILNEAMLDLEFSDDKTSAAPAAAATSTTAMSSDTEWDL